MSTLIGQLQNTPGGWCSRSRTSSLDVWSSGTSGVGRDADDQAELLRQGSRRGLPAGRPDSPRDGRAEEPGRRDAAGLSAICGRAGIHPEQFRATAEEVAGVELKEWFRKALSSTEELDYTEALDWFGLRFAPSDDPAKAWNLEVREDATDDQKAHFRSWVGGGKQVGPGDGSTSLGLAGMVHQTASKAARASSSNASPVAARVASSCSGRLAPTIAEVIPGWGAPRRCWPWPGPSRGCRQ